MRHWLAPALLFLVAVAVRAPGLGHSAHTDELYHVLAAEQYLADGTLSINGGAPYTRARLFTLTVAASMRAFGESVASARIPSLLTGSLLVPVVFLWLRGMGLLTAAWVAALLLCFSPVSIGYSQWVRFYAPQHLFVVLAAISAFALAAPHRSMARRAVLGLAGLACLAVALHLQILSIIVAGGIGVYLAVEAVRAVLRRGMSPVLVAVGMGVVVVLVSLAAATVARSFVLRMIALLGHVDTWAAWSRDQYQFYHWWLLEYYPLLWTLFPVFLLLGLRVSWRATVLCGSIFALALGVHSIAAWKHLRYFAYALPFFFVVVGLAAERILPALRAEVDRLASRVAGPNRQGRRAIRALVLGGIAAFLLFSNHAFIRTGRMLARSDISSFQAGHELVRAGWVPARAVLGPMARDVDVVIAGRDTPALYYLRRADYTLTREKLIRYDGVHPEFTPDWTVRVPVISQASSVGDIIRCNASGLIVVESWQVSNALMIPASTWSLITAETRPVPLDPGWGMVATTWTNPAPDPLSECAGRTPRAGRP